MDFIWSKDLKVNERLCFALEIDEPCDELTVCAVDSYQVYLDGKLVFYGPNRTAADYVRPAKLAIDGAKSVIIKVLSVGKPCYSFDFQSPFFGAELTKSGKEAYTSADFTCYRELSRIVDMPRYSRQRGFVEGYDFNREGIVPANTVRVKAPKILEIGASRAQYSRLDFVKDGSGIFEGFEEIKTPWWTKNPNFAAKTSDFDLARDFLPRAVNAFIAYDFRLTAEHTGFIRCKVKAEKPAEIALVFDEFLPDGKWTFARGSCNDYVYIKVPEGQTEFVTAEPYALKFLKVISSTAVDLQVNLVTYENDFKTKVSIKGNDKIERVFAAAENTFRQNAVDLFTDCPGRERAGWLCDSFFTGRAERLFTGENDIEKDFIVNLLLAETTELPNGMLPMCFPSEHDKNVYIPNWAMWFIVELNDYYKRSGDIELVNGAKEKVYGIISFFDDFINEYGLLENLKSWVFVEWSICNDPEHVKGVNFPSNMLYAYALEKAGELYGDLSLTSRAHAIKRQVVELSFNGEFFVDNAVRENGVLVRCENHLSETCQYYALFTGLSPNAEYERKIVTDFGPFRRDGYSEVGKSNAFIGNYLRLTWLCEIGEFDRVLDESVEYFSYMAENTGTLWEHDSPKASCCHGFASVIAVIILRCICGYKGVKNGAPVLDKRLPLSEKYELEIKFNY